MGREWDERKNDTGLYYMIIPGGNCCTLPPPPLFPLYLYAQSFAQQHKQRAYIDGEPVLDFERLTNAVCIVADTKADRLKEVPQKNIHLGGAEGQEKGRSAIEPSRLFQKGVPLANPCIKAEYGVTALSRVKSPECSTPVRHTYPRAAHSVANIHLFLRIKRLHDRPQ